MSISIELQIRLNVEEKQYLRDDGRVCLREAFAAIGKQRDQGAITAS